jgi:hypothetical protein
MIKVTEEPDEDWDVRENCCFCFGATRFWYEPKDVAVCPACAEGRAPEEVPSKENWCNAVTEKFYPHKYSRK